MNDPHGGHLVDRVADVTDPQNQQFDGTTIHLDENTYQDVINISSGRYSPLKGFMTQHDFLKVVEDMTLEDGTVFPLPVILDVDGETASTLAPGDKSPLVDPDGTTIGWLEVEEVFTYNEEHVARNVFGTDEQSHPGVAALYEKDHFIVGGPITLFDSIRYHEWDLFPAETRVLFAHNDWDTVAGFQTRNAPHRAHEYIQKSALELVGGLLIQPKLGEKKINDYRDDIIISAYSALIDHYYPAESVTMSSFPSRMRYAGPREAVFDAIVRKNQGCTHFIIGRDHAGVEDYYHKMAAQHVFDDIADIGIELLFYDYAFYCRQCDGMASEKTCPHDDKNQVHPSGSYIRELVLDQERPSTKLMRPEVADVVINADDPFVTENEETNQ